MRGILIMCTAIFTFWRDHILICGGSRAPHLQFLKLLFVAFENGSLGNHNQGTTPDGRDVQVSSRADKVSSVNEEGVLWTTKLDGRQMLQAPYKCFPEVKADMVIRRPTCSLVLT